MAGGCLWWASGPGDGDEIIFVVIQLGGLAGSEGDIPDFYTLIFDHWRCGGCGLSGGMELHRGRECEQYPTQMVCHGDAFPPY